MIKRIIIFSILVFFLMIVGCSPSEEMAKDNLTQIIRSGSRSMQVEAQSSGYVIRQADQVQIAVWGYPEFNCQGPVKENGAVTIPLLGEVVAAGLTKEQFTDQMKQKLSVYIQGEIQLSATITSAIPQKIAVLGAVTNQNNYPITTDVTLIEVLSAAGGTTIDSDLRHIRIIRNGLSDQPIDVDLTAYIENGNIEAIPMVRPGDTVFVPRKSNVIRELSDFMRDAIFIFGFFRIFN
jgi:polysaccharide export outer membrane protein